MRRPILLDNPPSPPSPSVRWSRLLETRYLSAGGLAAAVVGASAALAMLMPYMVTPAASETKATAAVVQPVAAKAAPSAGQPGSGVQYVGDVRQADRPCAEQTWPYIAANCLKPAAAAEQKSATARIAIDRSELKTVRAGMAPAPVVAETAVAAQPVTVATAPEIVAPMPAARPAPRQAAKDAGRELAPRDDLKQRARTARAEPKDIRPDARRTYASGSPADRNLPRIAEYDVAGPFGTTRRVVVTRSSLHQAAAFSDER